jgi:tetratricopeptide (TPR) repeat protein
MVRSMTGKKLPIKALSSAVALALLIAISPGIQAQETGSSTLSRLGGLEIERSAATIDKELSQRHNRRGNTYSNLERHEDAIEEYRLSLAADPNNVDSLRNLANIYYFLQRYDEAVPLLARFIRLDNTRSASVIAAQHTLGQLLRDAQRYDDAIDIDLRAIETEPYNDSQVYVMGNTYYNAGRGDLAIQIYEKAVQVIPANAFLHRTLGRMYEFEARMEDALAQYKAAAELDTGSQFYKDLITATEARINR